MNDQNNENDLDKQLACSSCGLTMGESRLLRDLKRGEITLARRAEPSVTAATDERALFDAFMQTPAPDNYDASVEDAWHIWQARAALASPAVSPTGEHLYATYRKDGAPWGDLLPSERAHWDHVAAWLNGAVSQKDGAGYCADCNSWGGEHRDNCKQRPERFSHAATTASAPVPHHFSCERKGYNPLCSGCEAEREAATASASIDNDEFWKHVIAYCKGVGNEGQALVDYVMSWHRAALARAPLPAQGSFEGRTVSVDVSTCDVDYGNRIFAELTGETGSDGTTLLAIETSRNFAAPSQAGDARDDNKESAK